MQTLISPEQPEGFSLEQHATESLERADEASGLDRRVDLTSIPVDWIVWAILALVAAGIRLPGRTNWPLSPAESRITSDAWSLLHGNDVSPMADTHPVVIQFTAFLFFLFGDSDSTARLLPLVSGIAILVVLFWLRNWFGKIPALSIAIVWTLSPVMTLNSLRIDSGAVLLPALLLTLVLTLTLSVESTRARAIVLGIAFAAGLTAHPLAWVVIPLTLITAMLLVRDFRLSGQLLTAAVSTVLSLLVIISWFATRPSGIWGFFTESLSTLWTEHFVSFGADWQLPLLVLIIDEPAILMLVAIGLVVSLGKIEWNITVPPAIFVSCVAWAIPMLTLGLLLGNKGPVLYSVTVFPLIVVAGLGLSMLLDGSAMTSWQRGVPLIWSVILIALMIATVRFADLLARGPSDDAMGWFISAGLLGLLVLLPLGYGVVRIAGTVGRSLVPVTLLALIVLTGAISVRTSILLHSTGTDRPGEILIAGSSSPAVGRIQHRLRTYSRDATALVQDVRNPEGGRALTIVIDERLADPFTWYFRDFPDLLIVHGPENLPDDIAPDVVIAATTDRDQWEMLLGQFQGRTYPARLLEPAKQEGSVYRNLLVSAVNPIAFRDLLNFAVYRSAPDVLEQQEMILLLRTDHAGPFWGEGAQDPIE